MVFIWAILHPSHPLSPPHPSYDTPAQSHTLLYTHTSPVTPPPSTTPILWSHQPSHTPCSTPTDQTSPVTPLPSTTPILWSHQPSHTPCSTPTDQTSPVTPLPLYPLIKLASHTPFPLSTPSPIHHSPWPLCSRRWWWSWTSPGQRCPRSATWSSFHQSPRCGSWSQCLEKQQQMLNHTHSEDEHVDQFEKWVLSWPTNLKHKHAYITIHKHAYITIHKHAYITIHKHAYITIHMLVDL